jgi:hypothetical protein
LREPQMVAAGGRVLDWATFDQMLRQLESSSRQN